MKHLSFPTVIYRNETIDEILDENFLKKASTLIYFFDSDNYIIAEPYEGNAFHIKINGEVVKRFKSRRRMYLSFISRIKTYKKRHQNLVL